MKRSLARGFTLLETVVAVAVAVLLGWLLFHVLAQLLLAGRLQAQRDTAQGAIAQLADNITTEEDDAWAIYVPPTDVHGVSNGDGHEVDFFARDGKQQPYFWAYAYDASSQTLTRYRFSSPGGSATADVTYGGVTAFSAATYPVTALKDASTPIYSAMYAGANLQSGIVHFYPSMPWIAGGNNITYVHVEASPFKRDLKLATTTAPSGFTIVLSYTPAPAVAFKTWPANLAVGTSGVSIGSTSGTVAALPRPSVYVARMLNALLAGGTASAAASTPCYAFGYTSSQTADVSLPASVSNALGVYVTTDGCETDSSGVPLTQPVAVAYEPSGNSGSYNIVASGSTCIQNGNANIGNWTPYSATGTQSSLQVTGQTGGTCDITLTDGVTTATPTPNSGLVNVSVLACGPGVSEPNNAAQVDCLWYGATAEGTCTQCSYGGISNEAEVWYYNAATKPGPNEDCSDVWESGACGWNQNGATPYCYRDFNPSTGAWTSNPTTLSNAAGYACSLSNTAYTAAPPAEAWTTIPCSGTKFACAHPPTGGGVPKLP